MYKPQTPFNVPARVLKGSYSKVNGVTVKTFTEGSLLWVSARSYGGTEKELNGKLVILDTMTVECFYTPEITSADGLMLLDDGSKWEIMNNPEDIERRHQFLKFKVQRVVGDA